LSDHVIHIQAGARGSYMGLADFAVLIVILTLALYVIFW
jgi:hypothetical protein